MTTMDVIANILKQLNTVELKKIVESNGISIAPSIVEAEINAREGKIAEKFKPFENKFYISKGDSYLRIYKIGTYDAKEYGIPYEMIYISTDDDVDTLDSETTISLSNGFVTGYDIDWRFNGCKECNASTWNEYLDRYNNMKNTVKNLIKD